MPSLLLTSASPKLSIFQFPMLCQRAGVREAGREHGQDSWPELAKGIFHAIKHHAYHINWGKLAMITPWASLSKW